MIRSISVFVVAVACLFATGASAASDKPLTAADNAEAQGLIDNYVQPVLREMNAAIALGSEDPAKACTMIRATQKKADEELVRTKAFRDRLAAEGKQIKGADQMVEGAIDMRDGMQITARSICDHGVGHTGDAQVDAEELKMQKLTAVLSTEMNGYIDAVQRHDSVEACKHLAKVVPANKELYALIIEARSRIPDGTPDAAKADEVINKLKPINETLEAEAAKCPAAS